MIESIPWTAIGGLTPWGVFVIVFLMVMRGDLTPR